MRLIQYKRRAIPVRWIKDIRIVDDGRMIAEGESKDGGKGFLCLYVGEHRLKTTYHGAEGQRRANERAKIAMTAMVDFLAGKEKVFDLDDLWPDGN